MGVRGDVELVDAPELLPALARLPGHMFWRAAARVDQTMEEFRPDGFDIYAYATLVALGEAEPRSQQAVARSIGTSRTTLARVAASLQAAGLVERVRNPGDRRSYLLTRTPAGIEAADLWQQHALGLEDRLTAALSRAQTSELRSLLVRAAAPGLAEDTPAAMRASIGFLVHQIHLRMHPAFLQALRPLGIEPRHFGSLVSLQHISPAPQHELARVMGVSGASIVGIVDDLEARGLVERRRDEADRRAQILTLRPGAPDTIGRAMSVSRDLHAAQLAELSPADAERLVELLATLVSVPG
ncbi:MarR family transcriptional regulator [Nocardioides mangrovicus]|uniref:MarR family transcriptional regulator n=1 Tax=Nocardioides mangrovicus TaxID=2478913 RepID=A0A3L8NYF9_9ACTN|nr:MarR family transcriptional regulator [Nocardioides mangrovicus]RLV47742.1 MarR family transcriptional regulator [Nocardioides mangrovicus]